MSNKQYRLLQGDSRDVLQKEYANSVDCIFTSPDPIRTRSQFIITSTILGELCKRVLKPNGSMWVHMEDAFNDEGSLMRWPARFSCEMVDYYSWIQRGERIWHLPVGDMGYFNEGKKVDNNRLIMDHCYVYHFTTSRHDYYNNFNDFTDSKGRKPCQICSIFNETRPKKPGTEEYEPGFSAELVKQSLLMSCPDGGTILDPFCGWGTTGVVALLMKDKNYKFVGIDIDEERLATAERRLANVQNGKGPESRS